MTTNVSAATTSAKTTINTRIGELKYENNYPANETVNKLYDEMDFQRACQAYLWGFPLVSAASVRRGLFQDIGATYNDFEMYPNYLDANGLWLTGNTTTIYSAAIIDLAKDGPVVVEIPAGPTAGMFGDYWFVTYGSRRSRSRQGPRWQVPPRATGLQRRPANRRLFRYAIQDERHHLFYSRHGGKR